MCCSCVRLIFAAPPMAEALARRAIDEARIDGWEVHSAGVRGRDGFPMHASAAATLAQDYGLSTSDWRSTRLTSSMIADVDLVLTMSSALRRAASSRPNHHRSDVLLP